MEDDSSFLDFADAFETDSEPTARGIIQCLRMLAEESSLLRLPRTLAALHAAISACSDEGGTGDIITMPDEMTRSRSLLLH